MVLLLFVASSQAAQTYREVPAEEILKKIEAGQPVEYDNVTIVGDLNVSGLKLSTVHVKRNEYEEYLFDLSDDSKVIASAINITNSLIMGSIDFKGVTLQKNVDLRNTEILNDTYFSGARFNQSAHFIDTRFNQSASFNYSIFNKSADIWGSWFNQDANREVLLYHTAPAPTDLALAFLVGGE